jgi:hypothetical protein
MQEIVNGRRQHQGNHRLKHQTGLSLIGLIFVLGIVALIAMLGIKVVPTVIEYLNVKKAIQASKQAGPAPADIKRAFDRQADVGYIDAVTSRDLVITRNGEDVDVSFAYVKKIPLVGPASLLLEYEGTTAKSGAVAKKPE